MAIRAHSLALISEAGHNFSDFLALLLSWVAVYFQSRPANASKTYGYTRAGVLVAFVNALTLIGVAGYIGYEAVVRFAHPAPVGSRIMMAVAAVGVVLNGSISYFLFRSAHANDVNLRSALVHQVGDTLSTAAVIVGGFLIRVTGRTWIDPALSIAIAALILWSSLDIIRETLNILLEGTPRGLHLSAIAASISAVEGVNEVHDLHVWSLGSADPRPLLPHLHPRHSALGERTHPARGEGPPRAVPHPPHHHPVRTRGMRGRAWMRHGGRGFRALACRTRALAAHEMSSRDLPQRPSLLIAPRCSSVISASGLPRSHLSDGTAASRPRV